MGSPESVDLTKVVIHGGVGLSYTAPHHVGLGDVGEDGDAAALAAHGEGGKEGLELGREAVPRDDGSGEHRLGYPQQVDGHVGRPHVGPVET